MSKKNHHHGENIHRMEQLPERPTPKGQPKSANMSIGAEGNLPPAEIKRLTHPKAKQQAKKPPKQTST